MSGRVIDDSPLSSQVSVLFCLEDICWNVLNVERSEKVYRSRLEKAGFNNIECKSYLELIKLLYGVNKEKTK